MQIEHMPGATAESSFALMPKLVLGLLKSR